MPWQRGKWSKTGHRAETDTSKELKPLNISAPIPPRHILPSAVKNLLLPIPRWDTQRGQSTKPETHLGHFVVFNYRAWLSFWTFWTLHFIFKFVCLESAGLQDPRICIAIDKCCCKNSATIQWTAEVLQIKEMPLAIWSTIHFTWSSSWHWTRSTTGQVSADPRTAASATLDCAQSVQDKYTAIRSVKVWGASAWQWSCGGVENLCFSCQQPTAVNMGHISPWADGVCWEQRHGEGL